MTQWGKKNVVNFYSSNRNKINDFCGQLTLAKFKNKLVAVGYL